MQVTIDTETGSGRVKTMANGVPHSAAFIGGDVDRATELNITAITELVWTPEMKTAFIASQEE